METVMIILALLFVAFVVLGAYATVKVVGAAKRSVDRTITQARRTVEDRTLMAKRYTQPGPLGQLAELRLTLRTSMRATQEALHAASPEDTSLTEALALFERLSAHGRELDDDLKRLEREPDKARISARLPELRERTRRITSKADSLRWAAQDRALRFAEDDLEALERQIQVETGALRHWTTAEPEEQATARPQRRESEQPGTAGPAHAEEPPAITARDSRRETTFPWEKARRPESTT